MTKFLFFLIIWICFSTAIAEAQIFGGIPPSVKWKYLNTLPARIIFPAGLDSSARQVAFLIDALSHTTLSTIGKQQRTVDIVFHNQTIVSNGYVQLAPFRSEFELTPSQNSFDLGSVPWNQTLAIHEYRHVQQFNNFRVGLSRAFYYLFGQDGLALANNLSVPDWFFEGDAVYQETLVSQQGRGRLPLFLTGFEALWVSGKNYSWMKLRNGSYRDYTPNHYPLGYMLVSYGREEYGADFWAKTAVEAAAFKGLFYPLQKAIRRNTGISYDSFRLRALDYFRNQLPEKAFTGFPAKFGKKETHFVSDQLFPQRTDSSGLIVLTKSYQLPPEFSVLQTNNGISKRLKFRSVSLDDAFSVRGHLLAYAAYEPDLRWDWIDYSVIRILNLNSKKDIRLTARTKYFSPDISPDEKLLVAVNMAIDGRSTLDILDLNSGKVVHPLPNPQNLIYTYPKFLNTNTLVAAVRNFKGEMALMQIDIPSGSQIQLTFWAMDPLGYLSVENEKVFFTRTWKGRDQGFYFEKGKIFSMSADADAGNYQLSESGGKLAWTSFTSAGYRVRTALSDNAWDKDSTRFSSIDTVEKHEVYSLDNPPFQIPYPLPDTVYPTKPYPLLSHPFNFHSWRPYINDPDFTLALIGQNVLNTFQSEIYAGYNRNEQSQRLGMDFIYGGLFPYLNIGAAYVFNRNGYFHGQKIYWNEFMPYAGLSVPLNLSRGRWTTQLEGGLNLTYHQEYFQGTYKDSIQNTSYLSLDPQILFTHQLQAGRMQIFPSFAQTVMLVYNRAVSQVYGNQFLASGSFYFPGLSNTNSLVLKAAWQQRDSVNQIRFSNNFPFARGYTGVNFYQEYGLSVNYHFPLFYPDWGFANMVYFLRIRANLFYDYTGVPVYATNGPAVQSAYRSAGIEIYFDTRWWNQLPLGFGIRYSRLFDPDYAGRGPNQWEFILPINILSKGYSSRLNLP